MKCLNSNLSLTQACSSFPVSQENILLISVNAERREQLFKQFSLSSFSLTTALALIDTCV